MKQILSSLSILCLLFLSRHAHAQCTAAQLNWDRLDYYYYTTGAPYGDGYGGSYVTTAMEQTQKFAIGPNYVTFTTSASGIAKGVNGTNTCDIVGYTGYDAQFTPTANNQTITLTFNTEVQNLSFTLYDIDYSARMDFSATNAASVAQTISLTKQASSILTLFSNGTTTPYVTASGTSLGNSDNRGTLTISVTGPVKKIILKATTRGSDPTFWLSDIDACVTGTFPTNYNQTGNNQPLQGPAGNQPDYFIVTPDNNSAYMVDPATGNAWFLFQDASNIYMNCFAYDPYNHILYYVSEGWPPVSTNNQLKKYDFNTGTISVVLNDITTALNIPTFDQSLEGSGACFYNGQLFLGVEGGQYSSTSTRKSIIYRIDFDASLNPTNICQVFAVNSYSGSTIIQDWADFIIKNGVLYNYNSASGTTAISYEHFNMMTGASVKYFNPGSTAYAGQAGMDWSGNLYNFFSSGIAKYNENGTYGSITPITAVTGGPWPGGSGDASENFRPQIDFGDAPASYDPNPVSPAAHVQDPNLHLGTNEDQEWVVRGQTALANSDNYDDGLSYVPIYDPSHSDYLTQLSVYNNTGADATVCAWIDFNGDGVFDATEGISVTVPTSASQQTIWLYWPPHTTTLTKGSYTYLRIRTTYASNGMTTSNPTGYYNSGEVEDYRVIVDNWPLATQLTNFEAQLTQAKTVQLKWNVTDQTNIDQYVIERSSNNSDWNLITSASVKNTNEHYEMTDNNPLPGTSYYRLRILSKDGKVQLSNVQKINNKADVFSFTITPNPAGNKASVHINSDEDQKHAVLYLINAQGVVVHKEKLVLALGSNSVKLPVENLPSGNYFVRITANQFNATHSIIINK